MKIRTRASSEVSRLWTEFGGLSDAELSVWLDAVTPVALGAQGAAASTTIGYLNTVVTLKTGHAPDLGDLNVDAIVGNLRGGVTVAEVYSRPFITARTLVSTGTPFRDALSQSGRRAETNINTDTTLAMRDSAYEFGRRVPSIRGWQRVIAGGKVCGLCVAASTQVYKTEDLLPIHDNCDCGVEPIFDSDGSNYKINNDRLDALRAASGEKYSETTRGPNGRLNASGLKSVGGYVDAQGNVSYGEVPNDAKAVLPDVTVREHGELGPVLTESSHNFTGPDEVG